MRASEAHRLRQQYCMTLLRILLDFHYEIVVLCCIILNRFVLSTLGFTTVTFSVGALQFLAPSVLTYATWARGDLPSGNETLYFGVCVCFCGLIGTAIGSYTAMHWKLTNPSGDPLGGSIE